MKTQTKLDPLQKVKVLIDLGLTTSQAKVYLALVQKGTSTAKTISEIASVQRPEVYVSLSKLEAMGLVERILAHPTEYRAISPNITIASLLKAKIKQNNELQAKATTLRQEITYENKNKQVTKEHEFILVPKDEALVNKIGEGIKSAEKSIYGVSSWNKWSCCFHTFAEEWKRAVERGAEIRLVTDRPEKLIRLPEFLEWVSSKNYANFSVKCIPDTVQVSTMIFDSKQMFVNTIEKGGLSEAPALWSNNRCVMMITQNYFESMWSKSSKHIFRTASLKRKASAQLLE